MIYTMIFKNQGETMKKLLSTILLSLALTTSAWANCTDLIAGQHTKAGEICITTDFTNLTVTYNLEGDWQFGEAHLWVGTSTTDMPQTRNGSPKIGNFPYTDEYLDGLTTKAFVIPLSDFEGVGCYQNETLFVAAHAALKQVVGGVVVSTETGWAAGDRFRERGSWATYFSYTLPCDEDPGTGPGGDRCETAWAYGSNAFCGDPVLGVTRWGWYDQLMAEGETTQTLWAGAGQCDTSKGTNVGSVSYNLNSGNLTVNIATTGEFYLTEVHYYADSSHIAPVHPNGGYTVAPGSLDEGRDADNGFTPRISDSWSEGNHIMPYVMTHAVVCAPESAWE